MVLKLYGAGRTTSVRRVAAFMREKNIPFELVAIDVAHGEHKSPAYKEKHPFGLVPYIDDDGFIIYESRAICRYLEDKYSDQGPKLIPTDPKNKAVFEQAASVEISYFDPFAKKAVDEKIFKPRRGLTPDQGVFDQSIVELDRKLDIYEVILSKQRYTAGDAFTLVDLFHLPEAWLLEAAGSRIMYDEKRPNVLRYKYFCSRKVASLTRDN
ncbi:Glutathione S-transferase [Termitomyces sp. T112]|nr:Glutathione S-transferase [Termitomyces sp. T112]